MKSGDDLWPHVTRHPCPVSPLSTCLTLPSLTLTSLPPVYLTLPSVPHLPFTPMSLLYLCVLSRVMTRERQKTTQYPDSWNKKSEKSKKSCPFSFEISRHICRRIRRNHAERGMKVECYTPSAFYSRACPVPPTSSHPLNPHLPHPCLIHLGLHPSSLNQLLSRHGTPWQ